MANGKETEDLFRDLEKQFQRAEGAHRRHSFLALIGSVVGFAFILTGLGMHVLISVFGYALMLGCVLVLAERIRDRVMLRFNEAAQRIRDEQERRRSARPRFYRGQ